jgi:type IV pilus assembly protein PilA
VEYRRGRGRRGGEGRLFNSGRRWHFSIMERVSPLLPRPASGGPRFSTASGFTLIELLIVTVIIGILASIAIPAFDGVRQKAYNSAALSDLKSTAYAVEEYYSDNLVFPDETQLMDSGFVLSPGVSFTTFSVRDAGDLRRARVHIHIEHEGSFHYYHKEYPGSDPPEMRWK